MSSTRIFTVVLAAGRATRYGETKQLEKVRGETLVHRAVRLSRQISGDDSVLVVGHDWRKVAAAADGQYGHLLVNERFADGLGTSISAAIRTVRDTASAVILILADQPLISTEHIRELLDAWSGKKNDIVATAFSGTVGPPVLFPPGAYDDLVHLDGDQGARSLLEDQRYSLSPVTFEPAAIDIDRPEDLTKLDQPFGG